MFALLNSHFAAAPAGLDDDSRRLPKGRMFPFFNRNDFAGVPSQRIRRPFKQFEAVINRALGNRVRDDGACGVDLWWALTKVQWRGSDEAVVSYTFREAGDLVARVREEGSYIHWYCNGSPGQVAPWISEAMAAEGWAWFASD